jgi:RNA polymerase sigma-70 factor, ECF subfamily
MPLSSDALAAHRHLIYRYALRLLGDADDAADVTQDVLIRLWHHSENVPVERMTAWVLRVTRNASLDLLRSRRKRLDHYDPATAADDLATDGRHSPDAIAESADFRRHLDQALARLDEPYRSIIILREIEQLSYRDIAEALDLPLNTLKVYLHRGRRSLRETLRAAIPVEDLLP